MLLKRLIFSIGGVFEGSVLVFIQFFKVTCHLTGVGKTMAFTSFMKFHFEHFVSQGALVLVVDSYPTPFLPCCHDIKN